MHAPETLKRAVLVLCVGALAALLYLAAGCTGQKQSEEAQPVKKAQPTQEAPAGGDQPAERHWVTTRIDVQVNRPGRSARWARITAAEPAVLARGEWLVVRGKRCVGRADGTTQIRLEAGELTAHNCR